MNAIQRFFFNIFLFCFGLGLLFFVKLDSYASSAITLKWSNGIPGVGVNASRSEFVFSPSSGSRYGAYVYYTNYDYSKPLGSMVLYTNSNEPITGTYYAWAYDSAGNEVSYNGGVEWTYYPSYFSQGVYSFDLFINNSFYCSSFLSSDQDAVLNYVRTGERPEIPYDSTLELDSFKVTSWSIGNFQALFKSKFDVKWSDSRISVVQVRITGTANEATFESSSSPFKGKFQADQFVFQKGDVIHLVATPYKSDGSYGTSLYYSVTYSDNIPFSNNYRKLVNNNTNDNTLTIPFNGSSGNDTVTLPVDGVTTNVSYKVNYNPVTNEYGDINIYEINYSPVVIYPDGTSDQEVDETQDTILNNYNTTNYYETTKNINLNFDIDFGDISANDIGEGFNGVSGFFNGFGGFISRLSNWLLALFPFLPPIVATTIVFMFGLVIFIAGVALILKIIGAVGNIIDAILPL